MNFPPLTIASLRCCVIGASLCVFAAAHAAEPIAVTASRNLVMLASFDDSMDLNFSCGDGWIHMAAMYEDVIQRREFPDRNKGPLAAIERGGGLFGDALRFSQSSEEVLYYEGSDFNDQRSTTPANWSVTVACWVRFDEAAAKSGLAAIPLQLTQPSEGGTTLSIECVSGSPAELRLVATSGPLSAVDDGSPGRRHVLIRVKRPPIDHDKWMHLAFTLERVNSDDWTPSRAALYMNGRLMGRPEVRFPMFVDLSKASLVLGHHFVGWMDDLGVFNRALRDDELRRLYDRKQRLR